MSYILLSTLNDFIIENILFNEFVINEELNIIEIELTINSEEDINNIISFLDMNWGGQFDILIKYNDYLRVQFNKNIRLYSLEEEKWQEEIIKKELKEFQKYF